jgi:hypothetical protein
LWFADATIVNDNKKLLRGIKEVFERPAKIPVGAAMPMRNAIPTRLESKVWCKTILCIDDDSPCWMVVEEH